MTGLLGFASGYHAMEHCDVLLMLGTDFPYRPFYPDDARVVQVDVRGEHIGRRVAGRRGAGRHGQGHDRGAARSPGSRPRRRRTWTRMTAHYRRTRKRLDALAHSHGDRGPIHPRS